MREQIKYVNHLNEVLVFGSDGLYVNENNLRDFSWDVVSENDRISGFKKGIERKKLPVQIAATNEGTSLKNRLFEIVEKDILAMKPGKLIIGDYYMKCFITGSKKKKYLVKKNYYMNNLEVSSDEPYWVKESMTRFNYGAGTLGTNLDFNNDFPMDYASNLLGQSLNNTSFVPEDFRMQIYGPVDVPSVAVNGHTYQVNKSVGNNEYLVIDSSAKTVVLIHSDGSEENCFNLRNKESYIFEKIPVGINTVSNSGVFKFDITILEKRGEPKWT